jgi:hypothetical protein
LDAAAASYPIIRLLTPHSSIQEYVFIVPSFSTSQVLHSGSHDVAEFLILLQISSMGAMVMTAWWW